MFYRILMLTNSLGIGGAETHIIELASALSRKGHTVFVASCGGVYVSELEKMGIRHFSLPLKSRHVKDLMHSARAIKKIICDERIDVVHSHARIPSLIADLVCKRTGTPFVTTVHYNFGRSPVLSHLTRWGDATLAVSRDLQGYLSQYGINSENVILTVNGINKDKFLRTDASHILQEFKLSNDDFVVVSVCRMDIGACQSAFDLIDSAVALSKAIPRLKILLVGNGNLYPDVRALARFINDTVGKKLIYAVGARTDIAAFCSAADAFVGVSRAALEAMASDTPVIFAGNQGFAGLFDPTLLKIYRDTNFTFRGLEASSPQKIYNELIRLHSMDIAQVRMLCESQKKLTTEEYSTELMAEHAITAYERAKKVNTFDFLICGYYGFDNMGDDSMLDAILRSLDGSCIAVTTKDGVLPAGVTGVTPVDRFNPLQMLRAIKKSRVVVFGGGNLLQDITSSRSLSYYLYVLKVAQLFGKKTMLYANGIGPVSPKNMPSVIKVLKKVDVISVREEDSYNLLLECGIDKDRLHLTADEVFAVEDAPCSELSLPKDEYVLISLRSWHALDDNFVVTLADYLGNLKKNYGLSPVFACLQDSVDLPVINAVASVVDSAQVYENLTREQFVALVKSSRFVLGMRLHSLVYACREGIPAIGIAYDKKVESFMRYTGGKTLSAMHLDGALLKQYTDSILSGEFTDVSEKMKALASKNATLAKSLLERTK